MPDASLDLSRPPRSVLPGSCAIALATLAALAVLAMLAQAIGQSTVPIASARGFSTPRFAQFRMLDPPLASYAPQESRGGGAHRSDGPGALSGGTVAALAGGALMLDSDSGELVHLDIDLKNRRQHRKRSSNRGMRVHARADIGHNAGQLLYDPRTDLALCSDRRGDRVTVLAVADRLRHVRDISTRAEPYGLALSPDGATLLVTTIADRQLTAYDWPSGRERWSVDLPPEPRAVVISPDGTRAVVTFATQSVLARIDLRRQHQHQRQRQPPPHTTAANTEAMIPTIGVELTSLARYHRESSRLASVVTEEPPRPHTSIDAILDTSVATPPVPDAGHPHARAAYTAAYLTAGVVAVPYQESIPAQRLEQVDTGAYGGSHLPISHRIAFVADRATDRARPGQVAQAHIGLGHIRASAYDRARDMLFLASYSSDFVLVFTRASGVDISLAWNVPVRVRSGGPCGPSGLALTDTGALLVHCQFGRALATLDPEPTKRGTATRGEWATAGAPVTRSRLSASAQRGRSLFTRSGNRRISDKGVLACLDCHPEGRADGLSWAIDGVRLQTPVLAGRMVGTQPYKWNGHDLTLGISIDHTVRRLGGQGLSDRENDDLVAYLESLPPPRTPTATDPQAVARGRVTFADVGCGDCHQGPALAERHTHELDSNLPYVNTPSLIGVSMSAPYFHDGSAASLRAVLLDNGTVHDMSDVSGLDEDKLADLIAYLNTL